MATGTKLDNIRFEAEEAQKTRMRDALGEGDLGEAFIQFTLNSRSRAEAVIEDALAKYRANRQYWSTVGAFAQNYTETVYKVMEPHTQGFALPSDKIAWYYHIQVIWEQWALVIQALTCGIDEDY